MSTRGMVISSAARGFDVFFITPAAPRSERMLEIPVPAEMPQRQQRARVHNSGSVRPDTASTEAGNEAVEPPIDWVAEMARAAGAAAAADPAMIDPNAVKPKNFGFPNVLPAPSKSPEFGWSHARTHRVESMPGGGIVVNLSDQCVLVFGPIPIPFPVCGIGKPKAKGDLFEHIHDPATPGDWKDPK